MHASTGAYIDDPVRMSDDVELMLDNEQRIS